VNPLHRRSDRAQIVEEGEGYEVAGVEDELRLREPRNAFLGQGTRAARQVCPR
jgi:hypothetical protein